MKQAGVRSAHPPFYGLNLLKQETAAHRAAVCLHIQLQQITWLQP